MTGPLHGLLSSLAVYCALCFIALATGRGLLRLIGARSPTSTLLSPVVALAFWTVALGVAVGWSVPIKQVAPWLWAATAIASVNGLRSIRSERAASWAGLAACAALPVVVMAPYFWLGLSDYAGSIAPDGWSYAAAGQYLWEHRRGLEMPPVPLHQYAQHLSNSRYISSSLLAFFSPLVHTGDTQSVSSLLQAWTLFCMACAVAFFAMASGLRVWMVAAIAGLSTVSGWIANLVWAYNLDNGLALVYMPALAGALRAGHIAEWRWALVRGGLLASALYTYPEMAPPILAGVVLIALPECWRRRAAWRAGLREGAMACLVAAALLTPGAAVLVPYLPQQIRSAAGSDRPGHTLFTGLLHSRDQPAAFWGLGGEHRLRRTRDVSNAIGVALSLLAAVGLAALAWRGEWGLAAIAVLLVMGAVWMIAVDRYAYGAYKFLVVGWWCLVIALVTGAKFLVERTRAGPARWTIGVAAGLLLLCVPVLRHTDGRSIAQYYDSPNRTLDMTRYRALRHVLDIAGTKPVLIAVDDWVASQWAVYYLRGGQIRVGLLRMYSAMPHVAPLINRDSPVDLGSIRYALTDATGDRARGAALGWKERWVSPPYILWERPG